MTPALFRALLFLLLLPSTSTVPLLPESAADAAGRPERIEKLLHLFLHVVGVTAAGIASSARVSYPPSLLLDDVMTRSFYVSVLLLLAISFYDTCQFESPDMLLVGRGWRRHRVALGDVPVVDESPHAALGCPDVTRPRWPHL